MMPTTKQPRALTWLARLLGACMLMTAGVTPAKDQIDPAAYPELAPEALLPAMLAELRHTLPDIYSVREMRLCPAEHIKLKGGQPSDWSVRFEFNAKNESGGFSGIRRDVAIFKNRRIAYPIGTSRQLARTGLEGMFSRTVDKQMAACKPIPDATIQQILEAPQ